MRVLTVTNLYPPDTIGGYELGCSQMVAALRGNGHQVTVLTSRPRRPIEPEAGVERLLRLSTWHLRSYRQPVVRALELTMDFQAHGVESANVAILLETIGRLNPDVVYLWNTAFLGTLGLVGAIAYIQVPMVWHLMDDVPKSMVRVAGKAVTSAGRAVSHRLRSRYLVCSQHLLDEIAAAGFDFGDRARIVRNWVAPRATCNRRWFPAGSDILRLVYAGQLAPHKGVDLILGAAQALLSAGRTEFTVDIFGSGLDDHYQRALLGLDIEDHVRLLGSRGQDEVIRRLVEYDVFLFPTWAREPFAFAPLEAAASGCVPMISNDCGNAEWLVDGVDCIKIQRDAGSIAGAIEAIFRSEIELPQIAARAMRTIRSSFSLSRAVAQVEAAFAEVLEEPQRQVGDFAGAYALAQLAERLTLDWAELPV